MSEQQQFPGRDRAHFARGVAASTAAMALAGAAAKTHAALQIDLLALPGPGYTVTNNGKNADVAALNTTVTFGVFATVSGLNHVQEIGDLDGQADADDTRNDDSLLIVVGSFSSVGSLLGDMNAAAGAVSYNTRTTPFNGSGSQNGTARDFDSDGDLDIGQPGTDNTFLWTTRAGAPTYATLLDGTAAGWTQPPDSSLNNPDDILLDDTSSRLRVGTLRLAVTGGSGATGVNFILRAGGNNNSALWFEDGIATGKNPGTATFITGAPVSVNLQSVPEPAAAGGPMALTALGLLARRKTSRSRDDNDAHLRQTCAR